MKKTTRKLRLDTDTIRTLVATDMTDVIGGGLGVTAHTERCTQTCLSACTCGVTSLINCQ